MKYKQIHLCIVRYNVSCYMSINNNDIVCMGIKHTGPHEHLQSLKYRRINFKNANDFMTFSAIHQQFVKFLPRTVLKSLKLYTLCEIVCMYM